MVSTLYERGFDVTSNVDKESVVRETLITHFSIPQRLITYVLPRILCSEIYSRALRLSEVANRTETTLSSTNNGVHYKGNRKHQIAAWLYITLAAIVSLAVGITNAGGRSGVYERVMDVFATASFLLVSVFGLVKLRSEDQGVLHNTLRGYELITSFKRVAEVTSGGDKELLRKCANLGLGNFSWLNSAGSCYATVDTTGVVLYSDGISNATLADNCWYYGGKTASNMITGRTASVSRWGNKYHFQYDAGTEQVYGYWFEPNGRTANRNVTGPMSADVIKTFNYKV